MNDFFIYYAEANLVCVLLFGVMLVHDVIGVDRQEKRVKFDHALIAFMLYFLSDAVWAGVKSGAIENTPTSSAVCNFLNFIFMAGMTVLWLRYVMAVEQSPHRHKPAVRVGILLPVVVCAAAMVLLWLTEPGILFNEQGQGRLTYQFFLVVVPSVYVIATLVYTLRRAAGEAIPETRHKHWYLGFFPLLTVICGLVQTIFFPRIPLFCQGCTVMMLFFYIRSMDTRISTDALTGLNNRGQMIRYIAQKSNLYLEDRLTYLVMFDINNFKTINDTYGHAEGDRALVLVAEALRGAVKGREVPCFLGRYGGDEFILVAHPLRKEEMEWLIEDIRSRIETAAKAESLPYRLTVGAGYDRLLPAPDTVQKCIQRADKKLYLDKEYRKLHEASEDAE